MRSVSAPDVSAVTFADFTVVPKPGTALLLGLGLVGMGALPV